MARKGKNWDKVKSQSKYPTGWVVEDELHPDMLELGENSNAAIIRVWTRLNEEQQQKELIDSIDWN